MSVFSLFAPRFAGRRGVLVFVAAACLACVSCKKSEERRGAPPPADPIETASAGACAQGGGTISDPMTAAMLPRTIGDYCVDPNGESRAYGSGTDRSIDDICLEAFNGACEAYKSFGLDRVVLARYVSNSPSPATIDVVVTKYQSADGAYAMFTERVVADADPMREQAPKPIEVEGIAALGTGVGYLYRGQMVVELTYANEKQTPQQLEASAGAILPSLSRAIAAKLPGSANAPLAAQRLPKAGLAVLGIRYEPKNAFAIRGAGAGAQGYYADGNKRFRVLSIVRSDPEQAADVLTSIAKLPGATRLKDIGEGAVRAMIGDGDDAKMEWIVGRSGSQIYGIGDEVAVTFSASAGIKPEEVYLSKDDKIKRLRDLLATKPAP